MTKIVDFRETPPAITDASAKEGDTLSGGVATLGRIRGYSKTFPSFFSTFFTAPPPQYTTCGGYSTGAAGSSVKRLSSRPTVANPVFV